MTSTNIYRQTFLYIKKHNVTGKLYFGKTVNNPEKYKGSGINWGKHLKEFGSNVSTLWYCLFLDKNTLIDFALNFSKSHNIVESDQWLNMCVENGIGGGNGKISHTKEWNDKISKALKDRPKSEAHKKSISEATKLTADKKGRKLKPPKRGSLEHIEKLRNAKLGKKRKPRSKEHSDNISKSLIGENNPQFGKKQSETHRHNRSIAVKEWWRKRKLIDPQTL